MVAALSLLMQNCCLSAGGGAAGNAEMAPLIAGLRAGTLVLWVVPATLVIGIGWRFRRLLRKAERD